MSEPIVFLDIDGVLNTGRSMRANGGRSRPFDREAVVALNTILEETDATIVLSSTWRHQRTDLELEELFVCEGLPPRCIRGATSRLTRSIVDGRPSMFWTSLPRGSEIRMWLDDHPGEWCYVVIDDDLEILRSGDLDYDRLLLTDYETGLTVDGALLVIEKLRKCP